MRPSGCYSPQRPDTSRKTGDIPTIGDEEFQSFRTLIFQASGIALADVKRELVRARLGKRLRQLGCRSFAEYYDYLMTRDPRGDERQEMLNCITTNKTEFFREAHHFDFLKQVLLPQLRERAGRGGHRRLRLWSAGSSTGEEAYSLAMTLREYFGPAAGWDLRILASDIDTEVLREGEFGIYPEERLEGMPAALKHKYFLRGTGARSGFVRVRPEVRNLVAFRRVNLVQEPWPIHARFDAIFCRNVIIYFNRETQERLFDRLAGHLHEGGCLFLGHSENMHGQPGGLFVPQGGTVYRFTGRRTTSRGAGVERTAPISRKAQKPEPPPRPGAARPSGKRGASAPRACQGVDTPHSPSLREVTVIVGGVYASREPAVVTTVLGSCVAACLFDPVAGVGGMNHFLLPGEVGQVETCTRYGIHAMELLISDIMKLGGDRCRLQAKVFGGARILNMEPSSRSVGATNARFVKEFLATEGIPVAAEHLGGGSGLKVRFLTHTGKAFVKPLEGTLVGDVAAAERRYKRELTTRVLRQVPEENITLFGDAS